jgi:hypothetical protein
MIYNSPYAVALLIFGLLVAIVAISRLVWWFRDLSRAHEQSERQPESSPSRVFLAVLRTEVRNALFVAVGIVIFTIALGWMVKSHLGW